MNNMPKGQIIGGEFGKIIVRQRSEAGIELGELLIAENEQEKMILQVYDLQYGSQISQINRELISGMSLEEDAEVNFYDGELRNYLLAMMKNILTLNKGNAGICKSMPPFFNTVREIKKDDVTFMTMPKNPIFLGDLRSGSKNLDFNVHIDGEKVFSHHILLAATTGRGKSNLTSVILWDAIPKTYCGNLVLDPHDEYYGRNGFGLKDHPEKDKVLYYTPRDAPPGAMTLKINLKTIRPHHFKGVINWSDPQLQALQAYYKKYGKDWIESLLTEQEISEEALKHFHESTIGVVKRTLTHMLDLDVNGDRIICRGIFDTQGGENTHKDIVNELEKSRLVIIDTSAFSGRVELLVGSLITNEVYSRYRNYKAEGQLEGKPIISVILEEAPRVLGKEILERGSNIFSTIAREGRKFRVGLFAITQLPSLIPRQILANMNTKIILGIEMAPERQAIIESAAQDLSEDSRNIASLNVGEAIVTSNFTKFAIPVKIPLFSDFVKKTMNQTSTESSKRTNAKNSFSGVDQG